VEEGGAFHEFKWMRKSWCDGCHGGIKSPLKR
jgi:hypothetical protein